MTQNNNAYHIPVMLPQCLEGLNIQPDGVYVDLTFGGGGHSKAIHSLLSSKGKLYSFDQDVDAKNNLWQADNFHFIDSNFAFVQNQLRLLGVKKVDGILADLGVSSHQFDEGIRGFSIRSEAILDMRMNQRATKSAKEVLNNYEHNQLLTVFQKYADLTKPHKIAQAILHHRAVRPLDTTADLMKAVETLAPKFKEHKYFAQIFQAVRIEVNNEMETLEQMLLQTSEILNPGGRLVVMSYHSLEDRLVKNYMKRGHLDGHIEKDFYGNVLKPLNEITRHPIIPNEEEIERNPRARSAKLRVAEKV
ncbi:MAG: 16S rRNA (cytosine(1402)-N(4))-methyltransferase RsmH [Bacteroidetes bacterium]|nr:16S rRNA (cytosine(1402)-N(4))-methyltransferase RsmH [Bacteroidota bacterium]